MKVFKKKISARIKFCLCKKNLNIKLNIHPNLLLIRHEINQTKTTEQSFLEPEVQEVENSFEDLNNSNSDNFSQVLLEVSNILKDKSSK